MVRYRQESSSTETQLKPIKLHKLKKETGHAVWSQKKPGNKRKDSHNKQSLSSSGINCHKKILWSFVMKPDAEGSDGLA